jgi:xylulokinase
MRYYLGVDIGTFESKGVLVDQMGEIVARAARPHKMIVPQPGWAEHRPLEDWWGDFVHITRALLEESKVAPEDIKAVGTSAIGPCMLPVDQDGEPLMNGVLYGVDGRATQEIEDLTREIGADAILEHSGNVLTTQSVGPKILWLKRNRPEIFAKTHKILTSTSFLVHRLTGVYVIDHYSAANTSPIYDVTTHDWNMKLAPDLIPRDMLPSLAWSTDIVGHVTEKASAETGLAVGTPVIAGTIDAASEAISVGVQSPGDMMVMYGSSSFIILVTAERVRDGRLWYAPWLFKGEHAAMAGMATAGTLTHWFRDQFARDLPPDQAMPLLASEAAESPPGANGLIFLPYLAGAQTPLYDAGARGSFFGLNLTHKRSDLFRALLEGIAFGTNHIIETFKDAGQDPKVIQSVGGGLKNKVWAQATSDVSGKRQTIRSRTFGASYGDAFLAALAIGDVKPATITEWNRVDSELVPDPKTSALYAKRFALFRALYEQTKALMHQLVD